MTVEVIAPGPLATIQDGGRMGYGALGVGRAGAADAPAFALANRLVGNPVGAAAIEVAMGGLVLYVVDAVVVALTGAPAPATVHAGPPLGHAAPAALPAGARVHLGTPPVGVRTYVAIRGGVDAAAVLGSRSYDTLGRIGPPPLRRGDRLDIGPDPRTPIEAEVAPVASRDPAVPLRIWPGPRAAWFGAGVDALTTRRWVVRGDSDRAGVRLDGPPLRREHGRELPSEGLVTGAIQVPHDGRPIVMLADHPVTGGYPVIAVVDPADLPAVAQARPGEVLRFAVHRT